MKPSRFGNLTFEWDDAKSASNKVKHGIEFIAAPHIFKGRVHVFQSSQIGEKRYLAVGLLQGRFFTVVYTMRGEVIRVISLRRARDDEERDYRARFPEGFA